MVQLPVVSYNFDDHCWAIDKEILVAAENNEFSLVVEAPKFEKIDKIPHFVYELIHHYTGRGFHCKFDGEDGTLKIDWSHPNMTWLEHRNITRAIPSMIPLLGKGFTASKLYLCMTNNQDLRKHSDVTLLRQLGTNIKKAATLGNNEVSFGFPEVNPGVLLNLFPRAFGDLISKGFQVSYDATQRLFLCKWGDTLSLDGGDGAVVEGAIEP